MLWEIDIEFIAKTEKKNRFIKINKHVLNCFSNKKVIAISNADVKINDFSIKYWTIFWFDTEIIELMWKSDRFAKKVKCKFERFSNKKNDSSIDDQKSDFWSNNEISDSTFVLISDMMFSWWFRFDLMI